ncbi:MAG TPA: hypothetical protein VHF69_08675 [Candidatus Synoicihabitans sp.]|nr:hypothetical protein [Candidatus Synoicihabitans sp.]
MNFSFRLPVVLVGLAALAPNPFVAQVPQISSPAPVKNYSISFFSEQGFHSMLIRGGAANLQDPRNIVVSNLTLTRYSGDSSRRVETVILSPEAVLQPETQVVTGPAAVRLVRDELELTGEDWRYEHHGKKILIRRNARIVFQAELSDLLK